MTFQLTGLNHKTAPVEFRERLGLGAAELPRALRAFAAQPQVEEAFILSTCNRVEFLAKCADGASDVLGFIGEHFGLQARELEPHFYQYQGAGAVRHLFRVASSLDSLVVGEPQVLGQVKEAYQIARGEGVLHSQLDTLLTRSFAVAKRVRTETAIGSSSVSIASVAVDLALQIFGSLKGRTVLLVGAGKMSALAAQHFRAAGAGRLMVANRTRERAEQMAQSFGAEVIDFAALHEQAHQAEIVVTSTGAETPIFSREDGERFMHRRKNRPMFFIDIAVPRDVSAEMGKVEGIFLYDVDDLQGVVAGNLSERNAAALRAEAIIESEVERFAAELRSRGVAPEIVDLQRHFEEIRRGEIARMRGKLGPLSAEQESAIEALTSGMMNKVLHAPISTLKAAAAEGGDEGRQLVNALRRIFRLGERGRAAESESAAKEADARKAGGRS